MNIQDALARFQTQLEADGRSIHTRRQYARHIRLFATQLAQGGHGGDVADIDHQHVAGFLAAPVARTRALGGVKRASSMNALRSSLRTFFSYLHEAGAIAQNPARLVRRALCGQAPPRALSDGERSRLLAALAADDTSEGRRDHVLFALMLATGIRVGSAVALDLRDVDLDRGELTLRSTKGDRPERVFLGAAIRDQLRAYIPERGDSALFVTRDGVRLTTRQVHRRLVGWLGPAAITRTASPHSLRHTFATGLYARTGDIALVQAALRHRAIASTLVYARVDAERVRAAVAGT